MLESATNSAGRPAPPHVNQTAVIPINGRVLPSVNPRRSLPLIGETAFEQPFDVGGVMKPLSILGGICIAAVAFSGAAKADPIPDFQLGNITINAGQNGNWGVNNTGMNNTGLNNGSEGNKGAFNGDQTNGDPRVQVVSEGRTGEGNTGFRNGNNNFATEGGNAGNDNTGAFNGNDNSATSGAAPTRSLMPPEQQEEEDLFASNAGNNNVGFGNGNRNMASFSGEAGNGNKGVQLGNDNEASEAIKVLDQSEDFLLEENGNVLLEAEGEAGNENVGFDSGNRNTAAFGAAGNGNRGSGNGNDNDADGILFFITEPNGEEIIVSERGEAGNNNIGAQSGNENEAFDGDAGISNVGFNNGNNNEGSGAKGPFPATQIFTGIAGSHNIGAGNGNGFSATMPTTSMNDVQGSFNLGANDIGFDLPGLP